MQGEGGPLPRRVRVVRVEFGPGHRALTYTAPPEVIARFAAALRAWNPAYRLEVDPAGSGDGPDLPPLPCWRLFAGD
jgi:hypothetical protein